MIESKNKEIKNEYDKLKIKYQNLMVECNYIKNTSNKMAIENRNLQIQVCNIIYIIKYINKLI